MSFHLYLSPPHPTGNELGLLQEVIDQNWMAPVGPHLQKFEQHIAQYLGSETYATALQSGTAALHLGLQLLGVGKGDVVICQSLTFVASVNPVVYLGATPVFIDSEPDTWNLCPLMLEMAIKDCISMGKKPKAIIAVHLYGMPYQVDAVHQLAKKYEIPVLEDSAEALGSTYHGKPCGSFGDLSIFSFNGNKIITSGGGGSLNCFNKSQHQYALKLATQAKEDAPHFEHTEVGYNYRMSSFNAAVGCAQWEVLEDYVRIRREHYHFYSNQLAALTDLKFLAEPTGVKSNRWLSVLLTKNLEQRERIRIALTSRGIESRPIWKPMHHQPLYKNEKAYRNGVSEELFNRGLCLPSGSQLTKEQLYLICAIIKENI